MSHTISVVLLLLVCGYVTESSVLQKWNDKIEGLFQREDDAEDLGESKAVCMPMMFHQEITPKDKEKVSKFQKGWLNDRKKFPAIAMSPAQSSWILGLSIDKSPRLSHGQKSAGRATSQNGKPCYIIPAPMRIRKEYRQLTAEERQSFHNALNSLKTHYPDPVNDPTMSGYDLIVQMHRSESAPAAHDGAAFLPWHREFLLRLENALYDQGYTGPGLPYWDSSLDQTLPDASDSAFFSDDYMGNNDGTVTSGPAANWTTIEGCNDIGRGLLQRNTFTGESGQRFLISDEFLLNEVYTKTCFKEITCYEGCDFEYAHGGPHVFVNGHMGSITCSPSDPIFFMHHCFIDCIWEQFRQKYQLTDRQREYPSEAANGNSIGRPAHEWDAPMKPFEGVINGQPNIFENWYLPDSHDGRELRQGTSLPPNLKVPHATRHDKPYVYIEDRKGLGFPMTSALLTGALGISDHYTNLYFRYAKRPGRCIANHQCESEALWCDRRACRCRAKVKLGGYCGDLPHMACYGKCSKGDHRTPKCRNSKCTCH